jgi:exosortase/archaeosortase family protein
VEVAEQCSGIRSSVCLVITSVLAGYLFLKKGWSKVVLVLSVFPITVFKNALRIVTLSLLAAYVDPGFIGRSWLHTSGGIPFFVVGLMLLGPVLWGLRKAEKAGGQKSATTKAKIQIPK